MKRRGKQVGNMCSRLGFVFPPLNVIASWRVGQRISCIGVYGISIFLTLFSCLLLIFDAVPIRAFEVIEITVLCFRGKRFSLEI